MTHDHHTQPAPPSSSNELRINHFLARAGVCSRRKADDLIAAQKVRVNGLAAAPGAKVGPKDNVTLEGREIPWPGPVSTDAKDAPNQAFVYILLNKPTQVVSTVKDPEGRTTVLDLLPEELRAARLFPVGRLDFFSQGLLILTNDGDLTYRLTHPKWHLPKVYHVLVRGGVTESALRAMREGMILSEGESVAPIDCRILRVTPKKDTWLEMTLIQGINRQIRRMLRDLNLTILVLARVRQGPLALGDLPQGQWRHLSRKEVDELRRGGEPQGATL